MLTAKEKRQRMISEAQVLFMQDHPGWFKKILWKIHKLVDNKPECVKLEVVEKWTRECERMACPMIKEKILTEFNYANPGTNTETPTIVSE